MAKKVTLLQPEFVIPEIPPFVPPKKEKVAAYARVSTSLEEQQTSLAAQDDYYRKKIVENPEWEFAGIYADDGLSGLSYLHREAFNRMLQDCRDGKITMILTKSISRFARNTVDSIKVIRELKALGVGVMFEKENIWTLDSKGEFLLTLMASLAQEESRSISENVRWGHHKRMEDGKYSVAFSRFFGYDQGKDGGFVLNEEEAVYVRRIFSLFFQGYSSRAICGIMDKEGIPTPAGDTGWNVGTVQYMISNEKYKGDALLQKFYVGDFLTKKQLANRGEQPQYYVSGGHAAIIEPDLFDYIQGIVKMRGKIGNAFSGQNPFSCRIICGVCGEFFGTKPFHVTDKVWCCRERGRTGHTCKNTFVYDYALWYQLKQVMMMLIKQRADVVKTCVTLVSENVRDPDLRDKAVKYIRRMRRINPDRIDFGEEPAYIIRDIIVYPDNEVRVVFIDDTSMELFLQRYTPKLGWRNCENKPKKEYRRKLSELTCLYCEQKFMAYPHAKRKYCSQECYIQARFGKKSDTGTDES